MYCKYGEYIDNFLNGMLEEQQEKELRNHAKECIHCAERLKTIDKIDKLIGKELDQYPYKSSKGEIMSMVKNKKSKVFVASILWNFRKYGYAAALVFALIISVHFFKPYLDHTKLTGPVEDGKERFAIYLVKKESASNALKYGGWVDNGNNGSKYVEGEKVDVNSLELEEKPILTDKDVLLYHWREHKIELAKEYLNKQGNPISHSEVTYDGSRILKASSSNAFVVVVNGKRKYAGGFNKVFSDIVIPGEFYILDIKITDYSNEINNSNTTKNLNGIRIINSRVSDDLRSDKEIFNIFKKEGKLVDVDKDFNEISAIEKVKNGIYKPGLTQFPDKPGKIKGTVYGGGPYPGIKELGEYETKVEKDKEGNYIVTLTQYWNLEKVPVSKHYWRWKVTENEELLLEDGGDFDPDQMK